MKTCLFLLSARDRLGVNNQKINLRVLWKNEFWRWLSEWWQVMQIYIEI